MGDVKYFSTKYFFFPGFSNPATEKGVRQPGQKFFFFKKKKNFFLKFFFFYFFRRNEKHNFCEIFLSPTLTLKITKDQKLTKQKRRKVFVYFVFE
ncbi:hypothetical protein UF32_23305 [Vibrio parahaemolyticus]|nr:hypothetical protein UF32_23305 [Vibrio parahaemolyticus]